MAGYYIDAAMLRKRWACESQISLFVKTFGNRRVPLTIDNIKKARDAGLDVEWPFRILWWRAPHGRSAERAAAALERALPAYLSDERVLEALESAADIWRMIDAERATGGHR